MSAAARTLTEALRRVFALDVATRRALPHAVALEAARTGGPVTPVSGEALPSGPLVRGRLAALDRAWAACPDPESVYRAAVASWRQEHGECPGCGAGVCACDSARRADSEEVA